MFSLFNILSYFLVYYMYDKTSKLQRRVDFLEYEMTCLGRVIYIPSAPPLNLLED
jgi:hypothetical protein